MYKHLLKLMLIFWPLFLLVKYPVIFSGLEYFVGCTALIKNDWQVFQFPGKPGTFTKFLLLRISSITLVIESHEGTGTNSCLCTGRVQWPHHIFCYYGENLFSWMEDDLETISYAFCVRVLCWKSPVPMSRSVSWTYFYLSYSPLVCQWFFCCFMLSSGRNT